jgi:hypothetical protein
MVKKRTAHRTFVLNPGRKSPLGRSKYKWIHDVIMYLRAVAYGSIDWIGLGQAWDQWRALVKAKMNF